MLHKVPIFRIFPYNNLFLQPVCELPSQPFMMSQRPRSLSQVNERSHTQLLVLPKDTKRGPYIKMERASSLTRGPTQKCSKPACRCRSAAKHGCKWLHPHNQIWNLPVSKWTRKVKMPLTMKPWISELLKGYSQTNGWRHYDSVHLYIQSFFFWLVHPMYTEANSKFCCWRLKTKGLKRGTICHLSMQLYPFIIIYLQALLCMTEVKTPEMMEAFAEVIIQLLQSDCRSV